MGLRWIILVAAALSCLSFPSYAQTTNYTYDALGRLVEVERVGTGKTRTYVYDDAGNRQSVIQTSDFGTFSVGDAIVTEGGVLSFTVTKTGGGVYPHDVAYSTSDGSADAGDYTPKSGTLTFDINDLSKTVTVNTTPDSTFEIDETLTLTLTSASNNGIIADPLGVGTIVDDDTAPAFSIGDAMATEGSDLVFTVTKAQSTALVHDVSYATADNSATAPSDYAATSGTLSFAPGETTKTITVPGAQDSAVEGDETFYVNLSSPSNGALLGDDQGVGTITDNDAASGDDIELRLFDPATGASVRVLSMSDTISASELSTGDYSLRMNYLGSASVGSVVFIEDGVLAQTENWAPYARFGDGQSSPLPGGAFTLKIEVWSGLHGGGTLLDEKTYTLGVSSTSPTLSINDQAVTEDAGTAVFTVMLTDAPSGAVTVDYATADDTALSGSDYTATSGTLTFTPGGGATQTISVPITDDAVVEGAESFHVNLTNAAGGNAAITDSQGVGTINDNDAASGDIELRLFDPATNANIRVLSLSDTISASELSTGDYSLRMNYLGSASVGSVVFIENGVIAHTENFAPYNRFGDGQSGPLPGGAFTLKIEVRAGTSGSGAVITEATYALGVN